MLAAKSTAHRRYLWRVMAAMSAYVVTLIAAELLIDKARLEGPLAFVLALLPGLCVAAVFWALGRLLVEERDEYLRMVLVRQLLTASGITMVVATIYGFLELYRFVPRPETYYISLLFFVALGLAAMINRLVFGDPVRC